MSSLPTLANAGLLVLAAVAASFAAIILACLVLVQLIVLLESFSHEVSPEYTATQVVVRQLIMSWLPIAVLCLGILAACLLGLHLIA